MYALVCTGTKLSRRRETRGMILANSDQERLTPTLRPNPPDQTLLTWTKMVSSAQLIYGKVSGNTKMVSSAQRNLIPLWWYHNTHWQKPSVYYTTLVLRGPVYYRRAVY